LTEKHWIGVVVGFACVASLGAVFVPRWTKQRELARRLEALNAASNHEVAAWQVRNLSAIGDIAVPHLLRILREGEHLQRLSVAKWIGFERGVEGVPFITPELAPHLIEAGKREPCLDVRVACGLRAFQLAGQAVEAEALPLLCGAFHLEASPLRRAVLFLLLLRYSMREAVEALITGLAAHRAEECEDPDQHQVMMGSLLYSLCMHLIQQEDGNIPEEYPALRSWWNKGADSSVISQQQHAVISGELRAWWHAHKHEFRPMEDVLREVGAEPLEAEPFPSDGP